MRLRLASSLFALALVACTSDENTPPAGSDDGGPDGTVQPNPTPDASTDDAADAGPPGDDTGTPDAGGDDDASVEDATIADANELDSTPPVDAADASDAIADAADAAPYAWPDAGVDCNPPTSGGGLSAAAAGIPSSGLVLWVRGDTGVYTPTTDAGDASAPTVCAWEDQSGHGWMLRPTAAPPPTSVAAGVGGKGALSFGAGAVLAVSGVLGIGPTSPRTIVAVQSISVANGRFHAFYQGQSGTGGTYLGLDDNTWQTAGSLEGVYFSNTSFDVGTATSTSARVHVLTFTNMTLNASASAAIDYRINGVAQTLSYRTGGNTILDFSSMDFSAIYSDTTNSTGVAGVALVAEVLVYDHALTLTDKQTIESALETRYGIP